MINRNRIFFRTLSTVENTHLAFVDISIIFALLRFDVVNDNSIPRLPFAIAPDIYFDRTRSIWSKDLFRWNFQVFQTFSTRFDRLDRSMGTRRDIRSSIMVVVQFDWLWKHQLQCFCFVFILHLESTSTDFFVLSSTVRMAAIRKKLVIVGDGACGMLIDVLFFSCLNDRFVVSSFR